MGYLLWPLFDKAVRGPYHALRMSEQFLHFRRPVCNMCLSLRINPTIFLITRIFAFTLINAPLKFQHSFKPHVRSKTLFHTQQTTKTTEARKNTHIHCLTTNRPKVPSILTRLSRSIVLSLLSYSIISYFVLLFVLSSFPSAVLQHPVPLAN